MRIILSDSQWNEERLNSLVNDEDTDHLDFLYSYWFEWKIFETGKTSESISNIRNYKTNSKLLRKPKFYLDSGVFSARKLNQKIDTKSLIRFCQKNEDVVDYVLNVDNGDINEQLQNCKDMKDEGCPVLGIWHSDMSYDDFLRFMDITPEFLAIGSPKREQKRTDGLFEFLYKKNLLPKIHILGTETPELLLRYPAYSIDSSKIVLSYIYGQLSKFDKKDIEMSFFHPRRTPMEVLKEYSDIEQFLENEVDSNLSIRMNRAKQAINSRFPFQKLITDIWKERGVEWND